MADDLRKIVGRNVKALRKAKGFSQESLAKACSTSLRHVFLIETCKQNLTLDSIERLAIALQCSPSTLLSDGHNLVDSAFKAKGEIILDAAPDGAELGLEFAIALLKAARKPKKKSRSRR